MAIRGTCRRLAVCLALVTMATGHGAEPDPLAAALEKPANLDVAGAALPDVAASLSRSHGIPIILDARALGAAGMRAKEVTIAAKAKDQPLGAALDDLLRPHKLIWITRHDVLLVTTTAAAEARYVEARVYRLTRPVPVQRRINTITSTVAPESWANVGGPGEAAPLPPRAMIVRQSPLVHRQIAAKFASSLVPVMARQPVELAGGGETAKKLAAPAPIDLEDVPLGDALRKLGGASGLKIAVDDKSLEDAGIRPRDLRITLHVGHSAAGKALRLAAGLSLLVEQADPQLTWTADDSGALVTTAKAAGRRLVRRDYDVADILPDGGLDTLIAAIRDTIAPADWEEVGGEGALKPGDKPGTLEVSQSDPVHRELAQLFAALRAARR
jgi:hypothetical protein